MEFTEANMKNSYFELFQAPYTITLLIHIIQRSNKRFNWQSAIHLLKVDDIQIKTGEIFTDVNGGQRRFPIFHRKIDHARSKRQLDFDESFIAVG